MKRPRPNFIPDFAVVGYGEYGHRESYDHHVFAGKDDFKGQMSYDSESGPPPPSPFVFDARHRSPQADKCHAQREWH